MPDIRLCITCDAWIDLLDPSVKVISQPRGGRTVVSVDGIVHVLATKKKSDKYRPTEVKEKEVESNPI